MLAASGSGVPGRLVVCLLALLLVGPATAMVPIEADSGQRLAGLEVGESIVLSGWPVDESQAADLVFTRIDVWDPEARVFVVGSAGVLTEHPRPARRHFIGRGVIDPGLAVVVAIGPDGRIDRMISFGANDTLEFRSGRHAVTGEEMLEPVQKEAPQGDASPRWTCGQEELPSVFPDVVPHVPGVHAMSLASLHTATVAVDTDNEFMSLKFGNNTTNATAYITDLFAAINVMYERDLNVRLLVGTTFLRVAADPYTQTTSGSATGAQLNEFSNYWAANQGGVTRALAAMLSGKQPTNNSATRSGTTSDRRTPTATHPPSTPATTAREAVSRAPRAVRQRRRSTGWPTSRARS